MKPILNIENLTKIYGNVPSQTKALNGITFQVMPGEFLGIMGSSGSGKSTLLRCATGLETPDSGEIIKTETFTAENTAGHDYGNWTSNHDGTHTGVCSRNASHTVTEACSGGSAYCMERAVCEKCKTEYGELGGHIFGSDWKCDNTYHWHECSGCKGVDSKVLHADNDKDHRCDACYHLLGTCADNNNDHKCDVCGKQLSECADNNNDHLCDTCCKKLTEHAGGTATCTASPSATQRRASATASPIG